MSINAISNNDQRRSCMAPMAKGAAIGALSGVVLKYAQPLAPQEKNDPEYKKVIAKINQQKSEYGPKTVTYLDNIKSKGSLSLAEDTFVKMFDGMKDGDHMKAGTIRKAIKDLEKQEPGQIGEFKRICKESTRVAEQTAKQCIKAYNLATKHIRPTSFFVISGAVVGALIAMFNDILKTNVEH